MQTLLKRILQRRHLALFVFALLSVAIAGCGKQPVAGNAGISPGPYIVANGDNLNSIAMRAYGDAKFWLPLLNANRQVASRPRFRLAVGETITIPARKDLDRSFPIPVYPGVLPADYIIMPG